MANGNIFISYRRGLDSNAAGRLYDRLERHFDRSRLYFDIDSIPLGVDFAAHIDAEVAKCDVQLVVIGPGWVRQIERLQNPDDFVRIEIEAALKRPDIPVIPVLFEGTEMPKREDLPDSLHALVGRNAIRLPHTQFSQIVDGRLVPALRDAVSVVHPPEAMEVEAAQSRADETNLDDRGELAPEAAAEPVRAEQAGPAATARTWQADAEVASGGTAGQAARDSGAVRDESSARRKLVRNAVLALLIIAPLVFALVRLSAPTDEVQFRTEEFPGHENEIIMEMLQAEIHELEAAQASGVPSEEVQVRIEELQAELDLRRRALDEHQRAQQFRMLGRGFCSNDGGFAEWNQVLGEVSPEQCFAECANTRACTGVTMQRASGECFLHTVRITQVLPEAPESTCYVRN